MKTTIANAMLSMTVAAAIGGCSRDADDPRERLAEQQQAVRTLQAAQQNVARQKLGEREHTLMRIPEGEPPVNMPVNRPPQGAGSIGEPVLGPPYSGNYDPERGDY